MRNRPWWWAVGYGAAAVAQALAAAGAKVAINYRSSRDAAGAVVANIRASGSEIFAIGADVADESAVDRMIAATVARFGGLDVLVLSSGLQRDTPFRELSLGDWQRVIDINLTGQFLSYRAAMR